MGVAVVKEGGVIRGPGATTLIKLSVVAGGGDVDVVAGVVVEVIEVAVVVVVLVLLFSRNGVISKYGGIYTFLLGVSVRTLV